MPLPHSVKKKKKREVQLIKAAKGIINDNEKLVRFEVGNHPFLSSFVM